MSKIADWVKETVSGTPGAGTITLGGAYSSSFIRFQDGFITGDKVIYEIADGVNRELGIGTLTTGTPWTLSRDTILKTLNGGTFTNGGTALTLSSSAIVGCVSAAETMGIVVGEAYAELTAYQDCTTLIPYDDSIPQITEGNQVVTCPYTPKFADSILKIQFLAHVYTLSTGNLATTALFKNSNANALSVAYNYSSGTVLCPLSSIYREVSGDTTSRTYTLRVGGVAAHVEVNGSGGSRKYGGTARTFIHITEYRQ